MGRGVVDEKVTMPGFGSIWYSASAIVTVFSMKSMVEKYDMYFDSKVEDAFYAYEKGTDKVAAKFTSTPEGLYKFKPSDGYFETVQRRENDATCLVQQQKKKKKDKYSVQTEEENKEGYSKRELLRATAARKLYFEAGIPSIREFKAFLISNQVGGMPVKPEDVDWMLDIFWFNR